MQILVTGAAGFIGWNLCKKLLADGHEVTAIDCFNEVLYSAHQKRWNIKDLQQHENFHFIQMDLSDPIQYEKLEDIFPEIVINEAGLPGQGVSWTNVEAYLNSNVLAVSLLADWSVKKKVKRFLQASTSSVYGNLAIGDEEGVYNPSSPYGVTKAAAEMLLKLALSESGVSYSIVRYFSVYGPGQRPDMGVYKFIKAGLLRESLGIYGDGTQSRDFTYIDDAIAATISVAISGDDGKVYNVSGGEKITINRLLEILEIELGELNIVFLDSPKGDQTHTLADTSRLRNELGWTSTVGCVEGLRRQITWQQTYIIS